VEKISLARHAMATRFEFVLLGTDPVRLRAAGEEALDEIDRIESLLSLYRPGSEIATINARASFGPVPVSPEVFALLERAVELSQLSGGAFDITIAPLVRCWGFMKSSGNLPTPSQIAQARELVGSQHLDLDSSRSTIRFKRAGVMLDLGSIGKGYALDLAAEVLRDAGVDNALLHGGTSTIYALGTDLHGKWKVAIDRPALPSDPPNAAQAPNAPLSIVELSNEALSVSAVWGKFFSHEGKVYGHVIDPRTGWPAENSLLGAVVVSSAADSDALSTIILLSDAGDDVKNRFPDVRFLKASHEGSQLKTISHQIDISEAQFRSISS
jgi:thiamine biosynthesis lipoprotein